jgi:hypothetical protein
MSGTPLYPHRPARDKSHRRWRIEYDLAYDGGGGRWNGYYRTQLGARICAFLNLYVLSWGGGAILHDQFRTLAAGAADPATEEGRP